MQSRPADTQQLDFTLNKPLLEMHSCFASIPMCNVAALTFMQLLMKSCVVAVFLKRHVRTWYCDRCLYCVNSYVLSSVLISENTPDKRLVFQKQCIKKSVYLLKYRHLCIHFHHCSVFLFSVTKPKLTMLSFPAKMCLFFNDFSC